MRRACLALAALASSGCHIIAGYDDLELREDPIHVWSERYGDEAPQRIDDLTALEDGVRVLGTFSGNLDLGVTAMNADDDSRFLAHFTSNGEPLWGERLPAGLEALALVPRTNRLVVQSTGVAFRGTDVPEGFSVLDVTEASVTVGLSGTGTLLGAHAVLVPEPEVFILGATFQGPLALTSNPSCVPVATDNDDVSSIAVARIADDGCWLNSYGDLDTQELDAIGVDSGGNVIVGGRYKGTLEGASLAPIGGYDFFVMKLSPNGTTEWARSFGQADRLQSPLELAVRDSGTISLAAFFEGSIDFGTGVLTSTQGTDIVVAKLDPTGATVWARQLSVPNDPYYFHPDDMDDMGVTLTTLSVAVDSVGNTVVAGHFRGEVDFGGTTRVSEGEVDMFLFKLDVDGELLWSGSFGDGALQCKFTDCAAAVSVDASDSIVLGGGFYGSMDLGGATLEAAGEEPDVFLGKFAP